MSVQTLLGKHGVSLANIFSHPYILFSTLIPRRKFTKLPPLERRLLLQIRKRYSALFTYYPPPYQLYILMYNLRAGNFRDIGANRGSLHVKAQTRANAENRLEK